MRSRKSSSDKLMYAEDVCLKEFRCSPFPSFPGIAYPLVIFRYHGALIVHVSPVFLSMYVALRAR